MALVMGPYSLPRILRLGPPPTKMRENTNTGIFSQNFSRFFAIFGKAEFRGIFSGITGGSDLHSEWQCTVHEYRYGGNFCRYRSFPTPCNTTTYRLWLVSVKWVRSEHLFMLFLKYCDQLYYFCKNFLTSKVSTFLILYLFSTSLCYMHLLFILTLRYDTIITRQ